MDTTLYQPNHTQVPNVIIDKWLSQLRNSEISVLLVICRKTIGWHKRTDRISKSQIEELTGLTRNTVADALTDLEAKGIILVRRTAGQPCEFEINYTADPTQEKGTPKSDPPQKLGTPPPQKLGGDPTQKLGTTKESVNKGKKDIYTVEFETFWETYDVKKGKKKSAQKFAKLKQSDVDAIMDNIPIFKTHYSKGFVPHPQTYLNNRYWEDEDFQEPSQSNQKSNGQSNGQSKRPNRAEEYFKRGNEIFEFDS